MEKFKVIYDTPHFIDGFEVDGGLEQAKQDALEVLITWLEDCYARNADPQEDLYDCAVWVEKLNEDGEYEEVWSPSYEDEELIGWPKFD